MKTKLKQSGFSLTEVLMAVGTLALGMALIAGVFPVAVHFTTQTIERTTAAVVADEAFAKIKLYKINFNHIFWAGPNPDPKLNCIDFGTVTNYAFLNPAIDYQYPSTNFTTSQQYSWSGICRLVDLQSRCVQVTVFVCRKVGAAATVPMPVSVGVSQPGSLPFDELQINSGFETLINDGYTIVDNQTGWIYRVLQRYPDQPTVIQLDRNWQGNINSSVWMIPPTFGGGRGPCVGVFQKVISF